MNLNKRPDFSLLELEKLKKKKRRDLTDLERQEIQEAFRLFDTDNDNRIDYHELKVYISIFNTRTFYYNCPMVIGNPNLSEFFLVEIITNFLI